VTDVCRRNIGVLIQIYDLRQLTAGFSGPTVGGAITQSWVGDFLRVGNDAIQPLEKSASKLLICNKLNFRACGLQIFDARPGERRRGRRERNGAWNGQPGEVAKSAGSRRNPRKHAGTRNKKGQPRAVDLCELVEGSGIEWESQLPHSKAYSSGANLTCMSLSVG
jgi:hypothetical protein